MKVFQIQNALPVPMLRQAFLELLLDHFWSLFSCVVLERFLEALFGVPGSILGSFWTNFGHFFDDFWCQVRSARIAPSAARIKFWRVWGVPGPSFFALFSASILRCIFLKMFDDF